jgi:xylan 1,4-beta-xylosidase
MRKIKNPILPGFHPDPSILRVGDDYYIATSTFEWFPGVQIHHSRDLVNWRLLAYGLKTKELLDLTGVPNSGGIWAPCLSYDQGTFYLIFTIVRSKTGIYKDTHNYLVTASDIQGPWSSPVFLNSSGFDPSLFHDTDGRKWLMNMLWDHRKGHNAFAGIALQEYDPKSQCLVGKVVNIFKGTPLGVTEGPHLYKREGYYYLLTAEGGTAWEHAVTMARSQNLEGPYTVDPANPMLTSATMPVLQLQKAGHASLVETQDGEWYLAHLCSRPLTPMKRCILGRETALQKCYWNSEGWLRLDGGGNYPRNESVAPGVQESILPKKQIVDQFDKQALDPHFNSLRVPIDESWCTLSQRPGFLRLYGRESLSSLNNQSLIARRIESFHIIAETCLEFHPDNFQQMAGLILFYDTNNYAYLRLTHHEDFLVCLGIETCDQGETEPLVHNEVPMSANRVYLQANMNEERLNFSYSQDGKVWNAIGPTYDASKLSDDYIASGEAFTGAFVGLCVQDLSGCKVVADFDYFKYLENSEMDEQHSREQSKKEYMLNNIPLVYVKSS